MKLFLIWLVLFVLCLVLGAPAWLTWIVGIITFTVPVLLFFFFSGVAGFVLGSLTSHRRF